MHQGRGYVTVPLTLAQMDIQTSSPSRPRDPATSSACCACLLHLLECLGCIVVERPRRVQGQQPQQLRNAASLRRNGTLPQHLGSNNSSSTSVGVGGSSFIYHAPSVITPPNLRGSSSHSSPREDEDHSESGHLLPKAREASSTISGSSSSRTEGSGVSGSQTSRTLQPRVLASKSITHKTEKRRAAATEAFSQATVEVPTGKGEAPVGPVLTQGQDEDDDFCPTCLDPYTADNPKVWTACGHHFHLPCIYEWMERKDTCPYCESKMDFPGLA